MKYMGSKARFAKEIIPIISKNRKESQWFVDLFCGSGVVAFNVAAKYKTVWLNDVIEELVGIHEALVLSANPDNPHFLETASLYFVAKDDAEGYQELRRDYNECPTPEKLLALLLSCTNNMGRFNQKGQFNQTFGKRTFNKNTDAKIQALLETVASYIDRFKFSGQHFKKVIPDTPSMVYIDPPYGYIKGTNGEKTSTQISEAGYNAFYTRDDDMSLYIRICELHLWGRSVMVSGLLEHNGHTSWLMDKLCNLPDFNWQPLDMNYDKVSRVKTDKQSVEIIVKNY